MRLCGQHICIRQGIRCPIDNTLIWYKSFSRHLMKQNKLKIKEEAKAMSRHANKYAIEDLEEWVAPLCPNSLVWGGPTLTTYYEDTWMYAGERSRGGREKEGPIGRRTSPGTRSLPSPSCPGCPGPKADLGARVQGSKESCHLHHVHHVHNGREQSRAEDRHRGQILSLLSILSSLPVASTSSTSLSSSIIN